MQLRGRRPLPLPSALSSLFRQHLLEARKLLGIRRALDRPNGNLLNLAIGLFGLAQQTRDLLGLLPNGLLQ
jgi:hypothetical protein